MVQDMPNYYSILPATIRYDNELKPLEKLLYSEITSLTTKNGECWAKNSYFAKLYNVSAKTISRYISHLNQKGYIKVVIKRKENKEVDKRIITINNIQEPMEIIDYTYGQAGPEGMDTDVQKNIININNKDNKDKNMENQIFICDTLKDDKTKIFDYLEKNYNRLLNSVEYQIVFDWKYDIEVIMCAINQALASNIKNIKYVDKILWTWNDNGLKTISQVKSYLKNKSIMKDRENQQNKDEMMEF